MAKQNPHTLANNSVKAAIRDTRSAGWRWVKVEIRPDHTVCINAGMSDAESNDDFLDSDLRMGK
jgi:hypothetical protein